MIKISNLDFSYSKKKDKLFSKLCFEAEKGKIYGLLGKNGAGKTTLLKQIAGLLYPKAGEITISGINSTKRHPEYLGKFFMIPEEFDLPALKIEQYLKIYGSFWEKFSKEQFYTYAEEFAIPNDSKLNKMSFGQKKKFLTAFGLACNTQIFICDEPTNGLDIPAKRQFRKILVSAIDENKIIIISTHHVKDIEGLPDNIAVLDKGKIIFSESTEEIGKKLHFDRTDDESVLPETLYYEKNPAGYSYIATNKTGTESSLPDIELLFNALINKKENILSQFLN